MNHDLWLDFQCGHVLWDQGHLHLHLGNIQATFHGDVALSQQSMMILPGQPGLSQQAVDLSQPNATPVPSWQPQRAPMTTPRPVVQGCGMAGMMHQFPPPPPSWGQQNQAWPRPSQYSQNTPTPPRTPSQWFGGYIHKDTIYCR